jgi:hypothetical protein
MKLTKKGRAKAVDDGANFGLYMWQFPDGSYLSDGEGNYLNLPGMRHDIAKMNSVQQTANYYGITEGKVVFMPGQTRVTDMEYEEDMQRFLEGNTPYGDFGAFADGNKNRR